MTHPRTAVRAVLVACLVAGALVALPGRAVATFHLMNVREVFAGTSQRPNVQFVELQMYSGQQRFVQGHPVIVYDETGAEIDRFTFGGPVLNGANQSSILVATPAAEAFFGVNADLQMTPAIPPEGGKVCFEDVDCVSWGSYSGGAGQTGDPFNPDDGIVRAASALRDISGGSNANQLDAGDDSDDSAADFEFGGPAPRNNAGTVGRAPGGDIAFESRTYSVAEGDGTAEITVTRDGGQGPVSVAYSTEAGSASAGSDYTNASGNLQFAQGETSKTFAVPVAADDADEGEETVRLHLRNPTGDAALGRPDATLTISDAGGGGDDEAPTTRIAKPANGEKYAPGKLEKIKGTASDSGSGVESVEVALRKNKKNGKCAWFDGDGFVEGACSSAVWLDAEGTEEWSYGLGIKLKSSTEGKIKSYTARARATDSAGNVDNDTEKGRNKNRFEIK